MSLVSCLRSERVATIHAAIADTSINPFFGSWLLRRKDPDHPPAKALALAGLGGVVLLAVGWFGGELVQLLGVSVSPGASLGAPNSLLSGE